MTQRHDNDTYLEFQSFLEGETSQPPAAVSNTILAHVSREVNPSLSRVFGKFGAVHVLSLVLTIAICPQFGLGPIGGGHGLMHILMKYGELACAAFCAIVFFGTTLLLSRILLSRHELHVASNRALGLATLVASLSFAFFMFLDAVTESVVVEMQAGLVWALAGGMLLYLLRFSKSLKH